MPAKTVVIAVGGNAMLQPGQKGDYATQLKNVEVASAQIYQVYKAGYKIVLTSGNGPQVGAIKLQNQAAAETSPEMPLHTCGAMSQGFIGYMMQQCIDNEFYKHGLHPKCSTTLTQSIVASDDKAFSNPTKPVGRFYTEAEAKELMQREPSKILKEDAGRGWRVVVPSPRPTVIVEYPVIKTLIDNDIIAISTNGGGIPVIKDGNKLVGVDAVIDKDLATSLLATTLNADYLMILTDVPNAFIKYNTPDAKALGEMKLSEMKKLETEGHFKAGSMGPKVRAAIEFTEKTGNTAIITSLDAAIDALEGKCGTRIIRD